jgi:hypothetical protein
MSTTRNGLHFQSQHKEWSILILVGLLLSMVFYHVQAQTVSAEQQSQIEWEAFHQSLVLKDKVIPFNFSYPKGWHVVDHSDSLQVSIQNVPPFNNPNELSGGLPEGFAKISFMIDPKMNPSDLKQGEAKVINGITWQEHVGVGEASGDRSLTLETVHEGVIFRIYTYIAGTKGDAALLENHATTLDQIVNSLTFEPTIPLERPPDAPPPPPDGK